MFITFARHIRIMLKIPVPFDAPVSKIYAPSTMNPLAISAMLTPFIQAQFCFIAIASSFKRA